MAPITEVMKINTVMDTIAASGRPNLQGMLETRERWRIQINHYFSYQKALLGLGTTNKSNLQSEWIPGTDTVVLCQSRSSGVWERCGGVGGFDCCCQWRLRVAVVTWSFCKMQEYQINSKNWSGLAPLKAKKKKLQWNIILRVNMIILWSCNTAVFA